MFFKLRLYAITGKDALGHKYNTYVAARTKIGARRRYNKQIAKQRVIRERTT